MIVRIVGIVCGEVRGLFVRRGCCLGSRILCGIRDGTGVGLWFRLGCLGFGLFVRLL
jgi:hypothetical protein